MLTLFCITDYEKKTIDNDTSDPGPFLNFFKYRNYSGQSTFSSEHREETESILSLLW